MRLYYRFAGWILRKFVYQSDVLFVDTEGRKYIVAGIEHFAVDPDPFQARIVERITYDAYGLQVRTGETRRWTPLEGVPADLKPIGE